MRGDTKGQPGDLRAMLMPAQPAQVQGSGWLGNPYAQPVTMVLPLAPADQPLAPPAQPAPASPFVPPQVVNNLLAQQTVQLNVENNILSGQVGSLAEDAKTLTDEKKALTQALQKITQDLARMHQEYTNVSALHKAGVDEIMALKKENASSKEQTTVLQDRNAALETQIASLQAAFEQELGALRAKLSERAPSVSQHSIQEPLAITQGTGIVHRDTFERKAVVDGKAMIVVTEQIVSIRPDNSLEQAKPAASVAAGAARPITPAASVAAGAAGPIAPAGNMGSTGVLLTDDKAAGIARWVADAVAAVESKNPAMVASTDSVPVSTSTSSHDGLTIPSQSGASAGVPALPVVDVESGASPYEKFTNMVIGLVADKSAAGSTSQVVAILQSIDPTPMSIWKDLIFDIGTKIVPESVRTGDQAQYAEKIAGEIMKIQLTPAAFNKVAFKAMIETGAYTDYSCIPHGLPKDVRVKLEGSVFDATAHADKFRTAMIFQYFTWGTTGANQLLAAVKAKQGEMELESDGAESEAKGSAPPRRTTLGWLSGAASKAVAVMKLMP